MERETISEEKNGMEVRVGTIVELLKIKKMMAQLLLVWFHPRALEAVLFDLTPITPCF